MKWKINTKPPTTRAGSSQHHRPPLLQQPKKDQAQEGSEHREEVGKVLRTENPMNEAASTPGPPSFLSPWNERSATNTSRGEHLIWLLSKLGFQLGEFRAFPSPSDIHLCLLFFCLQDWQWATLFTYFLKENIVCLSVSYRCQCLVCVGRQENKWTHYAAWRSPSLSPTSPPVRCLVSVLTAALQHTALCPCSICLDAQRARFQSVGFSFFFFCRTWPFITPKEKVLTDFTRIGPL